MTDKNTIDGDFDRIGRVLAVLVRTIEVLITAMLAYAIGVKHMHPSWISVVVSGYMLWTALFVYKPKWITALIQKLV